MDVLPDLKISYQLAASIIAAVGSIGAAVIGFLTYRQGRPQIDLITDFSAHWQPGGRDEELRIIITAHIAARHVPQRVDRVAYEEVMIDGSVKSWDRMIRAQDREEPTRSESKVPKVVPPESPGHIKIFRYYSSRPRVGLIKVVRDDSVVAMGRVELSDIWDASVPRDRT
jgi:hypothetical protein